MSKRIWFTQQKPLHYLPLRLGLGLIEDELPSTKEKYAEGDFRRISCPKVYTTRTHQLSGEYYVVERSRFRTKSVEPRIEFRADYPVRMKLDLRTGLINYEGKYAIGSVHSDKIGSSGMFKGEMPKGYTFAELDLGIRGSSFLDLRDILLELNKKATIDTPFFVNKLEPMIKCVIEKKREEE